MISRGRAGTAAGPGRALLLAAALIVAGAGCIGPHRQDWPANEIARSPGEILELPARREAPTWLLREAKGSRGAYIVEYGGATGDPAYAAVRVTYFRSPETAAHARLRLTEGYLARRFGARMTDGPRSVSYPVLLPGEQASVFTYGVRLPPEWGDVRLDGQIVALRAGRAVILVDSIGVEPARLIPALRALVDAAQRLLEPHLEPLTWSPHTMPGEAREATLPPSMMDGGPARPVRSTPWPPLVHGAAWTRKRLREARGRHRQHRTVSPRGGV